MCFHILSKREGQSFLQNSAGPLKNTIYDWEKLTLLCFFSLRLLYLSYVVVWYIKCSTCMTTNADVEIFFVMLPFIDRACVCSLAQSEDCSGTPVKVQKTESKVEPEMSSS